MVGLQIVHCNGCHWVTVYKEDKDTNIVKMFDSACTSLDQLNVSSIVQNIFCSSDELVNPQMQYANSNILWSVCSGNGYSYLEWSGSMQHDV